MSCDRFREQLTAYLDGELTDVRGSAVRGHLRGCDACRSAAENEAALRDGLRALPPMDPPPSLWAGVQAQLAKEEVADAERPAWRRLLQRLAPRAPQIAFGGLALAAAVTFVVVRAQREEAPAISKTLTEPQKTNVVIGPSKSETPAPPGPCNLGDQEDDVAAELAASPGRATQCYAATAKELLELAQEARTKWAEDKKREFDGRLASLQHDVDAATTDRAKQKSYRAMIRYLQRAAIRDEIRDVALATVVP